MYFLFVVAINGVVRPQKLWSKHPEIHARPAGTSPRAKKTVSAKDIQWADIIFVMEKKHRDLLRAEFKQILDLKDVQVLDIPDEYQFMDEELIDILRESVGGYLEKT